MRKNRIILAVWCVVVIVGIVVISLTYHKEEYNPSLRNCTKSVSYISLNVRQEPGSTKKVIGYLEKGDKVTLTGRKVIYPWEGDDYYAWFEIKYKEGTAWISSVGIQW